MKGILTIIAMFFLTIAFATQPTYKLFNTHLMYIDGTYYNVADISVISLELDNFILSSINKEDKSNTEASLIFVLDKITLEKRKSVNGVDFGSINRFVNQGLQLNYNLSRYYEIKFDCMNKLIKKS